MSLSQVKENKRKLSDDSAETPETKNARHGGSPPMVNVIDSIREATTVLLDDSITELCPDMASSDKSNPSGTECSETHVSVSAPSTSSSKSPSTNRSETHETSEIMSYLIKINERLTKVDERLEGVDTKLGTLDKLVKKVDAIDKDVTKLWNFVQDNCKKNEERINTCDDAVEELRLALGTANEKIEELNNARVLLTEDLDYIRSQSMRNNLVFGNIPEAKNEKPAVTEAKVRDLLSSIMNINKNTVDGIRIERAHRSTHPPQGKSDADFTYPDPDPESVTDTVTSARQYGPPRRPRTVIVKFASFKDRELVRNSGRNLSNTCYYVHEQFPKSVNDKRKKLIPRMKAAQQSGKKAWLSYDKLYIDGVLQPEEDRSSALGAGAPSSSATGPHASAWRGGDGGRGGRGGNRGRDGGRGGRASRGGGYRGGASGGHGR